MIKNVRWLYSKLGTEDFSGTGQTTITGALSTLQSGLDSKSPSSHTHTTATLPVSSNQVNSENYVPTSALLYRMVQRANSISERVQLANEIINGGSSDPSDPSIDITDPNTRYESKDLGTWSSVSDVDTFLSTYTHENNYTGLSLGNYVTIKDGKYDVEWVIAGFDMESNQTAADGTVYDNGYGICMIPKTSMDTSPFGSSEKLYPWASGSSPDTESGYINSYMHTRALPTVVTNLKNVLGTHVVNRNVLLSSSTKSSTGLSNAYTWTTAYATLMSAGQLTGTFASHQNQYDDGEANYKLPLFNYEEYVTSTYISYSYYLRGIYSSSDVYIARYKTSSAVCDITHGDCNLSGAHTRPLIYLR